MMSKSILSISVCLSLLGLLSGCATAKQKYTDNFVDSACAKDGGVKVYEKVLLPPGVKLFIYESYYATRPLYYYKNGQHVTHYDHTTQYRREINKDFFNYDAGENALGPDYIWKDLSKGMVEKSDSNFLLWRLHYQVSRKKDNKILGEMVIYRRRGGDGAVQRVLTLGGQSMYECPKDGHYEQLLESIFIQTPDKQ